MILLTMARAKMLLSPETDRVPSFMESSPSVINKNILNVQVKYILRGDFSYDVTKRYNLVEI